MIRVTVYKNSGRVVGFKIENHGDRRVCAAVSALSINCVNSLDKIARADVEVKAAKRGGFLEFRVRRPEGAATVLLESLELGFISIAGEYPRLIVIKTEVV